MSSYHVLVVTNLWPSVSDPGYGSFVQAQMESLRPLGVEYDVVFLNGRESLWNYVRGVAQVRRQLRAKPYDLIHAHFGLSGWVARFQSRVPVVVSFMGDDVLGRFRRNGGISLVGKLFRLTSYILARRVAAAVVKSAGMKAALRMDSVHVIPNGVDLELFHPLDQREARQALGISATKPFILFPFDPRIENKRYDLVEAAVKIADKEIPALDVLTIFGAPRDRMPLYLNAADALVLASQSEGSPNVVKEAMAVNLPVIAANVGDVATVIGNTEGCYIVERTAEAFAAKIVQVLRRGARTNGRERTANLSMENVAKQIVEVYASVVPRKERGAASA